MLIDDDYEIELIIVLVIILTTIAEFITGPTRMVYIMSYCINYKLTITLYCHQLHVLIAYHINISMLFNI